MINITSDGMSLTDALKSYAFNKMQKLERYSPINMSCLLKVDKRDNIVEMNIDGKFVKVRGINMYNCINKAVESACVVLEKNKVEYRV